MRVRNLMTAGFAGALMLALNGAELINGAAFSLEDVPSELTAHVKRGESVRFLLEENGTTGYRWEVIHGTNECAVTLEHRGPATDSRQAGAPGRLAVSVTRNPQVETPVLIELFYRRNWETNRPPAKFVRLVLYAVPGELPDARYPKTRMLMMLKAECAKRGIVLVDWHVHMRGGLTPELAAKREADCGIRQSAMENHGREWEICDNARLVAFAESARKIKVNGHSLPVGIQVNDRDWFRQIDAETRAKFDYVLADTMIMGKLPNGRDRRLWLVNDAAELGDPYVWMDAYVAHNLAILDEPISILANPGYLPAPFDGLRDELWTEARMRKVISKAVARGIALEIQAESPYPTVRFLKLAKEMGAKFSFGTNNFDPTPKDLSRWLEAIVWLDLHGEDIWSPEQKPQLIQSVTMARLDTSLGEIVLELDAAKAPVTVSNFIAYAQSGHYANTVFHRVIDGFMIQGGGFTADMIQKPTQAPIRNEAANGLKNVRGTVAMARTMVVDSATSQFFINLCDNAFLDYAAPNPRQFGYAVFGRVTKGMDVVDKIAKVRTGTHFPHRDVPVEPVVIRSVRIEK